MNHYKRLPPNIFSVLLKEFAPLRRRGRQKLANALTQMRLNHFLIKTQAQTPIFVNNHWTLDHA